MLSRLYQRSQYRADLLQLRCEQAESRALKAERIVSRALFLLGLVDSEASAQLQAEAAVS